MFGGVKSMKQKAIKWLKEAAILAVLVVVLSVGVGWWRAPKHAETQPIPQTLRLYDGTTFRFRNDAPLVIHFWGSWCPVCRAEIDTIEKLSKEVPVLTVAVKSGEDAEIAQFMKKHGLDFAVYNDRDGSMAARYGVQVFPSTLIYDASGTLRFSMSGYTTYAGFLARLNMIR